MRATLRRWWLMFYVVAVMTAAAWRHLRRARHRHHAHAVDVWPW